MNNRDYDTSINGFFIGTEYQLPLAAVTGPTIKANLELGYLLINAKSQDNAENSSDVKGNKVNVIVGSGADWGILSNKVKIGPFARIHFVGFSILTVGASAKLGF